MSAFNLSALAVRERSVTLFLMLAIFIAGVIAFLTLGRAEDPAFTIKQMTVITAWPGATAKEMEELEQKRREAVAAQHAAISAQHHSSYQSDYSQRENAITLALGALVGSFFD